MQGVAAHTPRRLNAAETFDAVTAWIAHAAKAERAPGLIVGISGTDSILTFLACARAFERMGKGDRVLGLHFEHQSKNAMIDNDPARQCAAPELDWVGREIIPWLKTQAPQALFETDATIAHSDDNRRWGHLFSRAVRQTDARHGMTSQHYFPVGTRNATEEALGTYSQISKAVSMLPIIGLYKTEVLQVCAHLGVPKIAMDKSREIDCDCGRFHVQANHMQALDWYIMHRQGLLAREYLKQHVAPDVLASVAEFYAEETAQNSYRARTPYRPAGDLAVILP